MNKFITVVSGLALAASLTAFAPITHAQSFDLGQTSVSGNVGVASRDDFRGQEYSTDANLDLGLKVSNIAFNGLYVAGDFGKNGNTFPANSFTVVRSDVGVGYVLPTFAGIGLDVSANHVYNAQEYLVVKNGRTTYGNYSELRVQATYNIAFLEVGQAFGPLQNTYARVGISVPVGDKLHVGAAVSAYHYSDAASTTAVNRYNNSEVFASYNVLKNLNVYGKYSFGGKNESNAVLSNYGIVGISYNF
jgi:hypothetical protein